MCSIFLLISLHLESAAVATTDRDDGFPAELTVHHPLLFCRDTSHAGWTRLLLLLLLLLLVQRYNRGGASSLGSRRTTLHRSEVGAYPHPKLSLSLSLSPSVFTSLAVIRRVSLCSCKGGFFHCKAAARCSLDCWNLSSEAVQHAVSLQHSHSNKPTVTLNFVNLDFGHTTMHLLHDYNACETFSRGRTYLYPFFFIALQVTFCCTGINSGNKFGPLNSRGVVMIGRLSGISLRWIYSLNYLNLIQVFFRYNWEQEPKKIELLIWPEKLRDVENPFIFHMKIEHLSKIVLIAKPWIC